MRNGPTIVVKTADELFDQRKQAALDAIETAETHGTDTSIQAAKQKARGFGVGFLASRSEGWNEAVEDARKLKEKAEAQAKERELLRATLEAKEALTKRAEAARLALLGNIEARRIACEAGLKIKGLELPPKTAPAQPQVTPTLSPKQPPQMPRGKPKGGEGQGR